MAGRRENHSVIWFVFTIAYLVSAVKSDLSDCKDVQCPPEITCPSDSVSRVTYEPPWYDKDQTTNSIDEEYIEEVEESELERVTRAMIPMRRIPTFLVDKSDEHKINKRSLQYKRRESIKIVPSDYISLVPESVRYHHQVHQNQHKWKRSVKSTNDASTVSKINECCYKESCMCSGYCSLPNCAKPQVAHAISPGSNIPGKCCPQYECIDEPQCEEDTTSVSFSIDQCIRCACESGRKLCLNECPEERPCFSESQKRAYLHGQAWQEGPCLHCECDKGENRCQISFCKPLDCEKQKKVENECCPICVPDDGTEDDITTSTETGDILLENVSHTTSKDTVTTPTTDSSLSSSAKVSTATKSPSVTTTSTIFSTTDKSSLPTISSTQQSPTIKSRTEVYPGIMETTEDSTRLLSNFTKITISTVPKISSQPVTTPITDYASNATKMSPTVYTPSKNSSSFDSDPESFILYGIIAMLLIFCCIFAGLYINEVTKKRSYSSIPNSDSNLSQMPRSNVQESVKEV